jgi:hypothetical protein
MNNPRNATDPEGSQINTKATRLRAALSPMRDQIGVKTDDQFDADGEAIHGFTIVNSTITMIGEKLFVP